VTHDEITSILKEAQAAGHAAAKAEMLDRLAKATDKTKVLDGCGGAMTTLEVDGRTALGKLLSSYTHPEFGFRKYDRFVVHIPFDFEIIPPANGQDMYLWVAAERAACEVIKRRMGVEAYVRTYVD
jgi:hypothetical protein